MKKRNLVMILSFIATLAIQTTGAIAEGGVDMAISGYELREGSSENTFAFPGDLPEEYDYGSGTIRGFMRESMNKKLPLPIGNATVMSAMHDTAQIQALYLWE